MKTLNVILFGLGLFLNPALQAQDDWTLKSPDTTRPSAGGDPRMIASLGGDQVLLFGGSDFGGAPNNETWVYDLSDNTWTLKSPATKPSARWFTPMASLGGDQVLIFSGPNHHVWDDETWVYDLSDNTWTPKSPATKPSARENHAMASLGGDQVLLFGGDDGSSKVDDTWVYDLSDNTWTQTSPAAKPSGRINHAMASLGGDQVLLFGGADGHLDDETWVYDLSDNTWTLKSPAARPSARWSTAMASLGGDQVLLFSGRVAGGADDNETWVYDLSDNTWTLKSPATKPSARDIAMASLGGDQVLLFGGSVAGGQYGETWVYTATPASVTKPFVFLANKVTLKSTKQSTSAGDIYSTGLLTVEKGKPSTYNSNLTAVGKITIQKDNTITGDVTSQTSISNFGTITGTPSVEPVDTEALPSLSYSAGGLNKTVPSGGSLAVAPGSYNLVTLNSGGTLKLTSGEYFFNELKHSGSEAEVEIDLSSGEQATINVVSNLQLGKEVAIRLLPNGESDSKLVTFNTLQSSAVNFGKEAYLLGSFHAPNAVVTLAKNSQLRGAISANEILVERDCLFLHHDSPGNLPKAFIDEEEVRRDPSSVTSYQLEQNYPNPFNPSTTIRFTLKEPGRVKLQIFNLRGEVVRTLANGEHKAGLHEKHWNGHDHTGNLVASGVYFYRLQIGERLYRGRMQMVK